MQTTAMAHDSAKKRHDHVLAEIKKAEANRRAKQRPVELVAVSKTFTTEQILPILANGQRVFGENRVQEAETKWPLLRQRYDDIRLHLIGALQTNKVKKAIELFDCIETVDRPKLARILAKELQHVENQPDLLIQVNTGAEPQKAGVEVDELDSLLTLCTDELGLKIKGLMCIPPQGDDPAEHFALLNQLANSRKLDWCSMGMSADYPLAIAHGATHVRVGSAIFGAR